MNNATDILTLENFWNDLKAKYPKAMKEWCDWIDEYKIKTNLKKLLGERTIKSPVHGFDDLEIKAPKVHELPIAFQIGLQIQFRFDKGLMPGYFDVHSDWKDSFIRLFRWRESVLNDEQIYY